MFNFGNILQPQQPVMQGGAQQPLPGTPASTPQIPAWNPLAGIRGLPSNPISFARPAYGFPSGQFGGGYSPFGRFTPQALAMGQQFSPFGHLPTGLPGNFGAPQGLNPMGGLPSNGSLFGGLPQPSQAQPAPSQPVPAPVAQQPNPTAPQPPRLGFGGLGGAM